ncbi:GNAT family N-acetyltransferase [Paractinoplanes lichenicola]|uniref:N-acetyltransferase n=1 Tax=Paractinoplanes lichenicola TaxID=2802976 RepID=A0ABS1W5G6_9ACTN|nr:GNAT family N-acetyltransferase [Actinoplanes lichenicola]MBL7261962.1 N-acetyltransferase [Actinoplanes lichenicola]
MSDVDVRDNPAEHRFELTVDGELGGMAVYRVRDGITVVTHSEIDRRFRGQGLANVLAQRTLDELRTRGARVYPACPFFAKYVAEHPEYDDIIED